MNNAQCEEKQSALRTILKVTNPFNMQSEFTVHIARRDTWLNELVGKSLNKIFKLNIKYIIKMAKVQIK